MFNLLVSVPLDIIDLDETEIESDTTNTATATTTWHWWKKLRTLLETNSKLNVVLELGDNTSLSDDEVNRWLSEPIKFLMLNTSLFLTNKHGFPVLSKGHQRLVCKFFKNDIDIIIEGINLHDNKGMENYAHYMNYLFKKYQQNVSCDNVSQFTESKFYLS